MQNLLFLGYVFFYLKKTLFCNIAKIKVLCHFKHTITVKYSHCILRCQFGNLKFAKLLSGDGKQKMLNKFVILVKLSIDALST